MQKRFLFTAIFSLAAGICLAAQNAWDVKSPDGNIRVEVTFSDQRLYYRIFHRGNEILEKSLLGVVLNDLSFSEGFELRSASPIRTVADQYSMVQGKKSNCTYRANEKQFHVRKAGKELKIIFRVSDDGVAFRYDFVKIGKVAASIAEETTSFNFPEEARGFLQPMSVAKTGWSGVNPCYEEFYEMDIPVTKKSTLGQGWVYPALFRVGETWVSITEAGLRENYCGTHLSEGSLDGQFTVVFPQPEEVFPGGDLNPVAEDQSSSPWRILTIGGLNTIIESTLGTDLADPAKEKKIPDYVKPGHASWSWALLKDDSIVYPVQQKYVDHASRMGWDYCLIDVNWDTKIGYEKMKELSAYAAQKGIGLILWYNSAGNWNEAPYTPRNVLLTHESRVKEFKRLNEMGIHGVKIDFFGGDGQSVIRYYLDILRDAATYGLMVNFHGATLPRGWQRTYPNLLTAEAVKGFEYVTFEQGNADHQPSHCAILPFTRNAFDPMDFTPLSLHTIPNISRRTSAAFELALSVIFLSGIQHFVETPEGTKHLPDYVKSFLHDLPVSWDETKFISGYPGKSIVLARRSGANWFVAGLNADKKPLELDLDLSFAGNASNASAILDGSDGSSFALRSVKPSDANFTLPPNGGFVLIINESKKGDGR